MADNDKSRWDNIPGIEGLEVDWGYEPDTTLGKRGQTRIENRAICAVLGGRDINVKVVGNNYEEKGLLLDLSTGGLALLLAKSLKVEQPVRLGFFLAKDKILAKAVVRNISQESHGYRVGLEFKQLEPGYANIITDIISTHALKDA